jgi:hypothetical protein
MHPVPDRPQSNDETDSSADGGEDTEEPADIRPQGRQSVLGITEPKAQPPPEWGGQNNAT